MRIEITGPVPRTRLFVDENAEFESKIVVPGAMVSSRDEFMSGHGTYYGEESIIASVAGTVQQVNKLVQVRPFKARYIPDIGDVIVGRVSDVQQKRWKVEMNSTQEGILNLANVSLPGGELRRKSAQDELRMRQYMEEGDLVVAEIHQIQTDGAIHLQARNSRYGKLGQGVLVKVAASLMKRRKSHFHNLHFGARVIFGRNGWCWISPIIETFGETATVNDSATVGEDTAKTVVPLETREVIIRLANCLKLLEASSQPIHEEILIQAYDASAEFPLKDILKPEYMDEIASEVRNKVAEIEA